MAAVNKIDSNVTGLRYAEEATYKTLPGTPDWEPLEPNSYADFGGQITTIARNPINEGRQRKKGVTTDLDASGGFNTDLTQTNLQDLLQGFFFANLIPKGEELVTAVDEDASNPDEYECASTTGFAVDDLIEGQNFTNSGNNTVNLVTAIVTDTSVEVATGTLTAEASPPATAQIVNVGHRFIVATVDIDATTTVNPRLVRASGSKDFTDFGLTPGEWIYIGGDTGTFDFVNAANNGFKRVREVAATYIEFDKSPTAMVDETGTGLTVEIFYGRVLKNRTGTDIVRRSYNLERQLGAPNDSSPSQIQAEYLTGQIPNEFTINIPTAEKVTCDLTFVGADSETIDGPTSLKTGNRPALVEADAFNTSSDVTRTKLSVFTNGTDAPTALFAFAQEVTITINNNVTGNKAVGTLGSFDATAGTFEVGGSITAYFADVDALTQVRNNADITFDIILVKSNSGVAIDLPLITLGDSRPNVSQDEPITIPLELEAATGAKIDTDLDHTMLMCFFDYLPNAADA